MAAGSFCHAGITALWYHACQLNIQHAGQLLETSPARKQLLGSKPAHCCGREEPCRLLGVEGPVLMAYSYHYHVPLSPNSQAGVPGTPVQGRGG